MMKTKYFFTLLITLFIFSCQEEKPEHLEGIWIGSYEAYVDQGTDSLYINGYLKNLFEIEGDSIHFKTFDWIHNEIVDTVRSFSYEFTDSMIIYGNDSLVLDQITADSLVIKNNTVPNYITVYKRANITSSPDVSFENDLYAISFKIWEDSLQFREDGLVLRVNDRDVNDGRLYDWYISSYKGLKFMVVIGQFDIPYLISGIQEDYVELQLYAEKIYDGSMKQLPDFDNHLELNGEWVMDSSKNPLGLLPYLDKHERNVLSDNIARLTIRDDSLTIRHYGAKETLPFWSDKTSRHLYFDLDETSEASEYWKIEWISNTSFHLTSNSWVFRDFTFKKVSD